MFGSRQRGRQIRPSITRGLPLMIIKLHRYPTSKRSPREGSVTGFVGGASTPVGTRLPHCVRVLWTFHSLTVWYGQTLIHAWIALPEEQYSNTVLMVFVINLPIRYFGQRRAVPVFR